jgi:hypothetical protein
VAAMETTMKLHEIETIIKDATGIKPWADNGGIEIFIEAERAEIIPAVRSGLEASGIQFSQKRARKSFKGALFFVPLKNVGTAFATNWEFA